jgi:hypothetical protein
VRAGAAELLERDLLAGHRLDDVGPGDEHVRGLVDHDDEVGDRGGVDRPARARSHDQRDLRDDARGVHVALEDLRVQAQRDHALLDPRAARVVEPDHRAAGRQRVVHDLADLLAEHLAERAAGHGEVLAENGDRAAVHGAVPGDDPVAVRAALFHPEVGRPVPGEFVELDERPLVEQGGDALARGHLALGVLLFHRARRAGVHGLVPAPLQVGDLARGGVDIEVTRRVGSLRGHAGQRNRTPPAVNRWPLR